MTEDKNFLNDFNLKTNGRRNIILGLNNSESSHFLSILSKCFTYKTTYKKDTRKKIVIKSKIAFQQCKHTKANVQNDINGRKNNLQCQRQDSVFSVFTLNVFLKDQATSYSSKK